MIQQFYIDQKLPSLNQYVKEVGRHYQGGAKFKRYYKEIIWAYYKEARIKPLKMPCRISFEWHEKKGGHKRDLDNIAFAKKFILDSLVDGGILPDDNRDVVTEFVDTFKLDAEATGVLITIEELEQK